jgi:putative membrane protein
MRMFFDRGFGYHAWGPWEVIMAIGMIAFWVAVVVLIVWLVRSWSPRQTGGQHVAPPAGPATSLETPLDILKRRYASGEIDKAEFDQKKQDLG